MNEGTNETLGLIEKWSIACRFKVNILMQSSITFRIIFRYNDIKHFPNTPHKNSRHVQLVQMFIKFFLCIVTDNGNQLFHQQTTEK